MCVLGGNGRVTTTDSPRRRPRELAASPVFGWRLSRDQPRDRPGTLHAGRSVAFLLTLAYADAMAGEGSPTT